MMFLSLFLWLLRIRVEYGFHLITYLKDGYQYFFSGKIRCLRTLRLSKILIYRKTIYWIGKEGVFLSFYYLVLVFSFGFCLKNSGFWRYILRKNDCIFLAWEVIGYFYLFSVFRNYYEYNINPHFLLLITIIIFIIYIGLIFIIVNHMV